jgi:hypothetical protein
LLNGDRSTVSTSRHQRIAREAIQRRAWPNGGANPVAHVAVIPFSALESAGIRRDTIIPLEVRPDTMLDVPHETTNAADVPDWHRYRTVWHTAETVDDVPADVAARGWSNYRYQGQYRDEVTGRYSWPERIELEPDADGVYRWTTQTHRLGDCLFTAETRRDVQRGRPCTVADVVNAAVRSINARRAHSGGILDVVETLDNLDTAAPIVEWVQLRRRRRYVSSFDRNEPAPLYFLATMPARSTARTVEDAILDLAPPAVHAALARGRHVERQGDIFAIATTLRDSDLQGDGYRRARLTLHARGARPVAGEPGYVKPLTAAERRAVTARARALWLERWQTLRAPAPRTNRKTAAERRLAIARDRENLARARDQGRRAIFDAVATVDGRRTFARYPAERARNAQTATRARLGALLAGDVQRDQYRTGAYAVQGQTTALALWETCKRDAYHELRPAARPAAVDRARVETRALLSIHGTAHTATEVCRAPGGRTYIRGRMVHAPDILNERRRRDHVHRRLEPGVWYLAVRNTVPRADTNGRR